MGDGWSDKSITPVIYTPDAGNDPALTIGNYDCETFPISQAKATVTTKITPVYPNLLEDVGSAQNAVATQLMSVLAERSDGDFLMIGANRAQKNSRVDNSVVALNAIPSPATTSYTVAAVRRIRNQTIILSYSGNNQGVFRSTDDGANFAQISGSSSVLVLRMISQPDEAGNVIIAGGNTIGGFTQPVIVLLTGYGGSGAASIVNMPAIVGKTGVSWFLQTADYVGNNTFLVSGIYNAGASGAFVVFKSTDNGANWSVAYDAAAAGINLPSASIVMGAGRWCATQNILSSGQSKIIYTSDYGANFTVRNAPANQVNFWPIQRRAGAALTGGTGTHADGFAYFVSAPNIASATLPGLWYTPDNCVTITRLSNQTINGLGNTSTYHANYCKWSDYDTEQFCYSYNPNVGIAYSGLGRTNSTQEIFVDVPVLAAFQPTSPAKLAGITTVTPQLDTTGKSGTVKLYLQHYNDEIAAWGSLADVADAWTDCGALTHNTPLTLPTLPARAGEKFRFRLGFTFSDRTMVLSAPDVLSLSFAWSSDVTAPSVPTITRIVDTSSGTQAGYRIDFGALPTGARQLVLEGKINSGAYSPFSNRAKFESGNGYMRFRGDVAQKEAAGERNETHLSFLKGLAIGDVVQAKIAAEDDVGNQSAFVVSDAVTLTGAVYVPILVDNTDLILADKDEITIEVTT